MKKNANACTCDNCPGASCTCGCQETAVKAGCNCGEDCRCEAGCRCVA